MQSMHQMSLSSTRKRLFMPRIIFVMSVHPQLKLGANGRCRRSMGDVRGLRSIALNDLDSVGCARVFLDMGLAHTCLRLYPGFDPGLEL